MSRIWHNPLLEKSTRQMKKSMGQLKKTWWIFAVTLFFMIIATRLFGTGCFFNSITGIPCPGCGITRSIWALLRLDFAASWQDYPMLLPCGIGLIGYFLSWINGVGSSKGRNCFLVVLGIAIVAVYVLRMLLYFPYTPPMVYNQRAMLPRLLQLAKRLLS
jgi:hypothetical protein